MPDFSAQHLLPEEAVLTRPESHARRFALPTAAAILLHAAVVGPLVWWTRSNPPEVPSAGIEVSPVEETAPAEATEPTEVMEETQAAQPEAAAAEVPPETASPPPPDAIQPPPPENAPPPPPDAVQPPPPDDAPPPPPDAVQPPPPEAVSEPPPPDTPPPEHIAPTPLIEPLAVEPPDSEDVVPPPPPEEAVETPPPPTPDAPEETVRAVAPPPPPPRPRPVVQPRPGPPQEAPPAPAAPAPAAAAPAAPARPPASYVGLLMAALERHKDYPISARSRRAEGTVVLRFAMRRDGAVASWNIVRSSGHEDLDQAVGQMIRRASPLPAPPSEMAGDPVVLVVPVRFTLRP